MFLHLSCFMEAAGKRMRLILLTLLLVAHVDAGILDSFRGILSSQGSFVQKFKNATVIGFRELFSNTTLFKIRDRFNNMKDKVMTLLKRSSENTKAFLERIKIMRPIKNDRVEDVGDNIYEVNKNSKVDTELYQGDMILTDEQAEEIIQGIEEEVSGRNRTKRQAYKDWRYPRTIWADGVNYYFHESASEEMRRAFKKAARLWEKNSCIDFKKNETAISVIHVIPSNGCFSRFGRRGGLQELSLGRGCETIGTAAHEIGHALGFFHTMSRHDRNKYIAVAVDNLRLDLASQFYQESERTNHNYGMEYDYGSIMHYGTHSATNNGEPTMMPYDVNYQQTLGSPFISFIDLSMINEHYKCKEKCDIATSAKCQMGGFPHPRNCSRCICPSGYAGELCTRRPHGCGKTIQASSKWTKLVDVMGVRLQTSLEFTKCHYWIESPPGTVIEVKLLDFTEGLSTDGCSYAGVEIKTNKDQTLTGYRFCSPQAAGTTLRSHINRVPIMTYNRKYETTTTLEYRFVPASQNGSRPTPEATGVRHTKSDKRRPFGQGSEERPNTKLTASTPVGSSSSSCEDSGSWCVTLVWSGLCDKEHAKSSAMKCPKSCGLC
ncbi:Zinc metalloproteinase [Trichostrongylus colubriformis]|uniref:Zinc metalloproteinase n=1 Tax=Trichostrongylus colubriformis TaxID=6319 RepID=A0AAN8IR43_TRICO